ncbi:MAG: RNA pseudouridine synthase [Chlamydiota bacterium]
MSLIYPYCDNHVLLVEKPAGISTQEGLDIEAKKWIKEKFDKPGNVFLEPIHRLDKPVSGLVLFARTSKALSRLQEEMRERVIKKTYFALVSGKMPHLEGTLEHYLVHDDFKARIVSKQEREGKLALLHYKVIKEKEGCTFLEIELITGRYHQIRAQLSHIGCPILGDDKYGSRHPFAEQGIALHHGRLSFIHPTTREYLTFYSMPPFAL